MPVAPDPLVLAASAELAEQAAAELAAAGRSIVRAAAGSGPGEAPNIPSGIFGGERGPARGDVRAEDVRAEDVRAGDVLLVDAGDVAGARAAVLAATRGAGVIAIVDPAAPAAARLHEDLRRLGRVELRIGYTHAPALSEQQRRLLVLLGAGATLDQAAGAVHVSRRTASRRIADARTALGVSTTAQAAAIVSAGTHRA